VVDEKRLYASWVNGETRDKSQVNYNTGIISAKAALNDLHKHLGEEGYTQVSIF